MLKCQHLKSPTFPGKLKIPSEMLYHESESFCPGTELNTWLCLAFVRGSSFWVVSLWFPLEPHQKGGPENQNHKTKRVAQRMRRLVIGFLQLREAQLPVLVPHGCHAKKRNMWGRRCLLWVIRSTPTKSGTCQNNPPGGRS